MENYKPKVNIKISFSELNAIADTVIKHARVIVIQRDPRDTKMDERSAIILKLLLRTSEKTHNLASAYPNIKEHPTHEKVLTLKLKQLLDKVLDSLLSDDDYANFLNNVIQRALNQ